MENKKYNNNNNNNDIEKAIRISKYAGEYLLKNFRSDKTLLKERGMSKEVTTKYDLESDRIIREEIIRLFPNHNILAEESGFLDKSSQYTWVVDSLDGSGNFASGNPFFSVSIALVKTDEKISSPELIMDGKVILGVIYAPFLDELYTAELGKGAFMNGIRINVSSVSELKNSYLVCCEGGSKTNDRLSKIYGAIYPNVKDLRKIGSAAIESAMVATGRVDGYLTLEISPWDVAAGILLVTEAGGKSSDFKNIPWKIMKSDLLLSNGIIHKDMINSLNYF